MICVILFPDCRCPVISYHVHHWSVWISHSSRVPRPEASASGPPPASDEANPAPNWTLLALNGQKIKRNNKKITRGKPGYSVFVYPPIMWLEFRVNSTTKNISLFALYFIYICIGFVGDVKNFLWSAHNKARNSTNNKPKKSKLSAVFFGSTYIYLCMPSAGREKSAERHSLSIRL